MTLDPTHAQASNSKDISPTDRRRLQSQASTDALTRAQTAVTDLDSRLDVNATQTENQESALTAAKEQIIRSKMELKALAKEREKLTSTRMKAIKASAKAKNKAKLAEGKYDQAVLADMVQREKQNAQLELQKRTQPPKTISDQPTVEGSDPNTTDAAHRSEDPSSDSPGLTPEEESLSLATSRQTAARTTGAQAETSVPSELSAPGSDPVTSDASLQPPPGREAR